MEIFEVKCSHQNLSHTETIEAYHITNYSKDGSVWFNNEYGNKIKDHVTCNDCKKYWIVEESSPKFILEFHKKVQYDRETKM
jgi:hypothetical protein